MVKFFMVWVTGTTGTHKRYCVRADAEAEAERLARQTRRYVYVLESVAMCSVADAPIQWEREEAWQPRKPPQ